MLITLIAVIFHRQATLPLPPNTIAAVLCYLCNSQIPEKFNDLALLDDQTRNQRVRDMELKYGIGVVKDTSQITGVGINIETFDS